MQDADRWLADLLQGLAPERLAQAKSEIKAKLLESYRNGQGASRNDGPEPPAAAPAYSGNPPTGGRRDYRRQQYRRPYRNGR